MTFGKSWCAFFVGSSSAVLGATYYLSTKAASACQSVMTNFVNSFIDSDIILPSKNLSVLVNFPAVPLPYGGYTEPFTADLPIQTPDIFLATIRNMMGKEVIDTLVSLPAKAGNAAEALTWAAGGFLLLSILGIGTSLIYTHFKNKDLKEDLERQLIFPPPSPLSRAV